MGVSIYKFDVSLHVVFYKLLKHGCAQIVVVGKYLTHSNTQTTQIAEPAHKSIKYSTVQNV